MTTKMFLLIMFLLIALFSVSTLTGYSFHENSIENFLNDETKDGGDCVTKALILEGYVYADLLKDLKVKDCQEINWLYEKVMKKRWNIDA